jgi:hypothetical protein
MASSSSGGGGSSSDSGSRAALQELLDALAPLIERAPSLGNAVAERLRAAYDAPPLVAIEVALRERLDVERARAILFALEGGAARSAAIAAFPRFLAAAPLAAPSTSLDSHPGRKLQMIALTLLAMRHIARDFDAVVAPFVEAGGVAVLGGLVRANPPGSPLATQALDVLTQITAHAG